MQGHFEQVRRAQSPAEAERLLSEMKTLAKRNYRKASRKLHPDLTGNDPKKSELFRVLTEVMDEVGKLKIHSPPPRPRPTTIRWVIRYHR